MKLLLNDAYCTYKHNIMNYQTVKPIAFTSIPRISLHDKMIVQSTNYVYLFELMQNLSSTLSKEDVNKLNLQIKNILNDFKEENLPELIRIAGDKVNEILAILKKSGIKNKEENNLIKYSDEPNKVNYLTRKKIKEIIIQQVALREALKHYKPHTRLINFPTMGDWFSGFEKVQQLPNDINSLFEHPVNKALFLTGKYTDNDSVLIKKKSDIFSHYSTRKILIKKETVLNALKLILEIPNQNFYGAFSDIELKKIKKLSVEYDSFDEILKKRYIFNKALESVVFNTNKKISTKDIGENINGVGVIIKKTKIYDSNKKQEVPCIVVFNNSSNISNLRLLKIDKAFEDKIKDLENNYQKLRNSEIFNSSKLEEYIAFLNSNAKSLIDTEKSLIVSEISFNVVNKKMAKAFIDDIPKPLESNEVLKVINDENTNIFPIIRDFKSHDPERYRHAGREIALPLLHLLFQNGCDTLLIKALAINSTHSPVGMYLRNGFEPISHNKEKIKEIILNSSKGFDYKEPVWLYLPKDSILKEIVAKENPLKEIFKLKTA